MSDFEKKEEKHKVVLIQTSPGFCTRDAILYFDCSHPFLYFFHDGIRHAIQQQVTEVE